MLLKAVTNMLMDLTEVNSSGEPTGLLMLLLEGASLEEIPPELQECLDDTARYLIEGNGDIIQLRDKLFAIWVHSFSKGSEFPEFKDDSFYQKLIAYWLDKNSSNLIYS